jgi:hypothetical protein
MPLLVLVVLVMLAFVALVPISIVQRFRVGTRRRRARRWVITLNLVAVLASLSLLLPAVLITSRWVPDALPHALVGLAAGCALGLLGVVLTRWEAIDGVMQYTPNRWLVLTITTVVAARVLYGIWRTWDAWRASLEQMTWVAASGAATSMSAGAVVLGYYLVYWAGVRARV